MKKIQIEIDCENGCHYCDGYADGCCMIFNEYLDYNAKLQTFERCKQCIEAEVQDEI